jgi:hypothetical protein
MIQAVGQGLSRRLVLLGASNLSRGFSSILASTRNLWSEPVEILAAMGHGRSYGGWRGVPWQTLPGIRECGLWKTLDHKPPMKTFALVTDVGNDLLYAEPVVQILGWVEGCVDRLLRLDAKVLMTTLPVCSLQQMSRPKFYLFRSLFFPDCRLGYETVIEQAYALNEGLSRLAQAKGLTLVEPRAEWYGVDPIHIRWGTQERAWREILSGWEERMGSGGERSSWRQWFSMQRLAPEHYWFFGIERHRVQPTGLMENGTVLGLY